MRQRLHLIRVLVAAAFCRRVRRRRRCANRPRRRNREGRSRSADQGRDDHRRESERVAEQLHRDDRRQRAVLDHRAARADSGRSARRRRASRPKSGRLNVQTIGAPNPPLTFTLKKGGAPAPAGALGGLAAKDLQAELAAADALYNAQKWDDAVAAYRGDHGEGAGAQRHQPADRRRVPQQEGLRQRRSPRTTSC